MLIIGDFEITVDYKFISGLPAICVKITHEGIVVFNRNYINRNFTESTYNDW